MENVDNPTDHADSRPRPVQQGNNEGETTTRNRNLDILKAYIQRQRALLERIKQDVNRLETSKDTVVAASSSVLSHILHNKNGNDNFQKHEEESLDALTGGVRKLTGLVSEVHGVSEGKITKDVDWNVYRGSDLNPLRVLQQRSRTSLIPSSARFSAAPPLGPSTPSLVTPRCSLSSFVSLDCIFNKSTERKESIYQVRVREERAKRIDPVLTIAAQFIESLPPDSDDECVRQARAKEARDAKEAKAREARDAKEAKGKGAREGRKANTQKNSKAATARPGKKNARVPKSARRRKSEASAAAAAVRPRGYGGRFKKKEPVNETTSAGQGAQPVGASLCTSASAPAISASISTSSLADASPSTQPSQLASTNGLAEDSFSIDNGRPQRVRKPSIRFGSAAPSASSSRSARSGSAASRRPSGGVASDRQPSAAPVVPSNPQCGRLTIRIPARVPTKSVARDVRDVQDVPDYRDGQFSASTSITAGTTIATGESGSTNQVFSAAESTRDPWGGKRYGPSGWPAADQTPTPASVILGDSVFDIREEEHENEMDIDGWAALDERNGRFRQDSLHGGFEAPYQVPHEASSQVVGAMDLNDDDDMLDENENESDSDSDDSFVPELLPPIPSSSTSSSSASRAGGASTGDLASGGSPNGKTGFGGNRMGSRRGDPASKTFNKAWSDEEQRLLDMLLERYPDGTKNRWANISRAMGGTRTPRQVASRVQKYFAKMKKWGIDLS